MALNKYSMNNCQLTESKSSRIKQLLTILQDTDECDIAPEELAKFVDSRSSRPSIKSIDWNKVSSKNKAYAKCCELLSEILY